MNTPTPSYPSILGAAPGAPALLGLILLALPVTLVAQDPPPPPEPGDRCVCVQRLPSGAEDQVQFFRFQMDELAPRLEVMRDRIGTVMTQALSRARLGVTLIGDPVGDEPGVRVAGVARGSPAEAAGLREGDRITHFNEHDLTRPLPGETEGTVRLRMSENAPLGRFLHLAGEMEPEDTVRIRYLRDGTAGETTVVAEAAIGARAFRFTPSTIQLPEPERVRILEGARPLATVTPFTQVFTRRGQLGIQVAPLNEDLAGYFGRNDGVLVLDVADDAPLELRAGDLILAVGDREVRDPAHLRSILASYRAGEAIQLTLWREGREVRVEGEIR